MSTKTVLRYDAPWPVFTLDWCNSVGPYGSAKPSSIFRIAVGSFVESYQNAIQIIGLPESATLNDDSGAPGSGGSAGGSTGGGNDYFSNPPNPQSQPQPNSDFGVLAEAHHGYPATKMLWEPAGANGTQWKFKARAESELLATTGEALRIWEYDPEGARRAGRGQSYVGRNNGAGQGTLKEVQKCSSAKGSNAPAPLTSFAWNAISPPLIVTSSIDTTCTVWDINNNSAITQLIAHDKDVYDVAWLPHSTDSFVSVGADGSLRAFDLRSLEHSTILYESPVGTPSIPAGPDDMVTTPVARGSAPPLARVIFSPTDSNYIAMFHLDSSKVTIIDMRTPGRPLAELIAHQGNINAIGWGQCDGATIATAGDDCQMLLWDLSQNVMSPHRVTPTDITNLPPPGEVRDPMLAYSAPGEINSLAWSFPIVGGVFGQKPLEWIAAAEGRTVRALRV